MCSAVSFLIRDHGWTVSPSQGSTPGTGVGAGAGSRRRSGGSRRRPARGGGLAAALQILEHVVLRHPPREPAALDGTDIHVVLGRDPADQRGGFPAQTLLGRFDAAISLRRRARGRARVLPEPERRPAGAGLGDGAGAGAGKPGRAPAARARRRGRGSRGLFRPDRRVGLDLGDHGLHRDRLAFLHQDLGQRAGRRRRDLGVHLVGGDLEDRLVPLHRLADLLDPAGQRALGDGLAHLGHDDVYLGHTELPVSTPRAISPPARCLRSAAARSLPVAARTAAARRAPRRAESARPATRTRAR